MKIRRVLLAAILGAVFVALPLSSAFNPPDIERVNWFCFAQKDFQADCSQFVAEGAGEAQNVILLIGDGMGIGQVYAGRVYLNGPADPLVWEELPHRGLVNTCAIRGITDSAASGTAMATGRKTKNSVISMDPTGEESYETILQQVKGRKATGLVTNTAIWDATPAVFAAHAGRRSQRHEIARQMVEDTQPDVMLGGGARAFESEGELNLIERASEQGYAVVRDRDELLAVDADRTPKLLGLFKGGSMTFVDDRDEDNREPHLSDMARTALDILGRDERGLFLMIEGGRIDHACHRVDMKKLIAEMIEFNRTIELVLEWAESRPGTLIVITADHETGGMWVLNRKYQKGDRIKVKWTTMLAPGYAGHSSQRVPIYAQGPNAGAVKKRMDNTEVYCVMKNAFDAPRP